jgi:hypothetical protein
MRALRHIKELTDGTIKVKRDLLSGMSESRRRESGVREGTLRRSGEDERKEAGYSKVSWMGPDSLLQLHIYRDNIDSLAAIPRNPQCLKGKKRARARD